MKKFDGNIFPYRATAVLSTFNYKVLVTAEAQYKKQVQLQFFFGLHSFFLFKLDDVTFFKIFNERVYTEYNNAECLHFELVLQFYELNICVTGGSDNMNASGISTCCNVHIQSVCH